jgi:hypothetical protein
VVPVLREAFRELEYSAPDAEIPRLDPSTGMDEANWTSLSET